MSNEKPAAQLQEKNGATNPMGNSVGSGGNSTKPSLVTNPAKSPDVFAGSGVASNSARGPLDSLTGRHYVRAGANVTGAANAASRRGRSVRPAARARAGST